MRQETNAAETLNLRIYHTESGLKLSIYMFSESHTHSCDNVATYKMYSYYIKSIMYLKHALNKRISENVVFLVDFKPAPYRVMN